MPSEEMDEPQDRKCLDINPSIKAKALPGRVVKTSRSGDLVFWGNPVWFEVPDHSSQVDVLFPG